MVACVVNARLGQYFATHPSQGRAPFGRIDRGHMSRFRDQTVTTAHRKKNLRKGGESPGRVPFRAIPPISAKIRYGERWSRFDPGTLTCVGACVTLGLVAMLVARRHFADGL